MEGISRRLRLEKKQRRRKGLDWLMKAGIACFLLLVAWMIFGQLKSMIIQRLIKVEIASYSVLEEVVPLDGIIIKGETVLTAPVTGDLYTVVPEGKRVRVGEVLVRVRALGTTGETEGQDFPVVAPVTGMVSYHFDGLEHVLSPYILDELDMEKIDQIVSQPGQKSAAKSTVKKGEILVKIVDNIGGLEIYATPDRGVLTRQLKVGQNVELRVVGLENTIKAQVKNVQDTPEKWRVLFVTSEFLPQALTDRQIHLEMVAHRLSGIILPRQALAVEDGKDGVYVVTTRGIRWREIQQVGIIGDQVAVEGIPEGTRVVLNPRYLDK
ncbi:MAG: HlyD family efflux transporter periplasmic adaptor subunit [Bacillota bacterium]